MDQAEGKALLGDLLATFDRAPSVSTGTSGHSGDLVIWDNTGVMHRACTLRPVLRAAKCTAPP